MLDQTSFIGQIASIEAVYPHGPRYNASSEEENLLDIGLGTSVYKLTGHINIFSNVVKPV